MATDIDRQIDRLQEVFARKDEYVIYLEMIVYFYR
jgi:hypothetical protein